MANNEVTGPSAPAPTSPAAVSALAWLRALPHAPRNAHEALALTVHALLLGHGFRDADVDVENTGGAERPPQLNADWGVGGYGGRYRHGRSALVFEVRTTPLGARVRVTGAHDAAARNDDVATLDLPVAAHYVDATDIQTADGAHWTDGLRDLDAAATLVLVHVAHRLVPDAAKEGYESGAAASSGAASTAAGAPRPAPPPHQPYPRAPLAYEDDPLRAGPVRGGPRNPYVPQYGPPGIPALAGFGSDDRDPQMPRMTGFGGFGGYGGGGGFGGYGGGGYGGGGYGGMGGGNLMGPRNFMPPSRGGQPPIVGGGRGLPPGVPPGARYDPMGPGGIGPDNSTERPPDDDRPSGMY